MEDKSTEAPGRPIPDCYWVRDGWLLAGEYPGHLRGSTTKARLQRFIEVGIRDFIDLTEDWELEPYAGLLSRLGARRRLELSHTRLAIPDRSVPSVATMRAILDTIDTGIARQRPQYLHCWGGVGRTGTVVGCWLVRHGATGTAALAQLDAWWRSIPKRERHPRSPETDEQRKFVLRWWG